VANIVRILVCRNEQVLGRSGVALPKQAGNTNYRQELKYSVKFVLWSKW